MKRLAWSSRLGVDLPANGAMNPRFPSPGSFGAQDDRPPKSAEPSDARSHGAADGDLRIGGELRVAENPEVAVILDICRKASGMRFAAIALPPNEPGGHPIICAVSDALELGVRPGDDLEIESLLAGAVQNGHGRTRTGGTSDAPRFRPAPQNEVSSHVSVPIVRSDGTAFGVLCAGDPNDVGCGSGMRPLFEHLAMLVAVNLDIRDEVDSYRAALTLERETARLREEFIAIVGHDLRNPIAAVSAGLRMLDHKPTAESAATLVPEMQRSMRRMEQITDNLLDFARGRLGSGVSISASDVDLRPVLRDVTQEIERVSDKPINSSFALSEAIRCDPQRIGQLLSNLLGNAVIHGDADAPVQLGASTAEGRFQLTVTNRGTPIPNAMLPSLFRPFSRGDAAGKAGPQGLGLGLYIAAEIATAHDGWIDVKTDDIETTFVFTMPIARG